ncbi:hypothetical protein N7495_007247 [Penicillium taxi]|uniref:uncharacterized protein n=1 Tax=Penicillium taxi TaxID=168475 RepID=UPI002545111B|nr:uncharacterized protein N7495_007247 [Penicillium taxi]KAJ5895556.1 hypothetical protein N7495_007247 [Penicillium taxi]
MFARLINILIPSTTPSTTPSTLLVIGRFGTTVNILHLVPEDGTIERFSFTSPSPTFHRGGAKEQAREQIGVVTLHIGDGEDTNSFLDDVETRIHKLQNDSLGSSQPQLQIGCVEVTQLVQDVIRSAALDAIHVREGRDRSINAMQTYPVSLVHISRSRAGRIMINRNELTSIHQ